MTADSDRIGSIMAAMAAGAPWWLALEATASTALDRDETCGTYSLPEEKPCPPTL